MYRFIAGPSLHSVLHCADLSRSIAPTGDDGGPEAITMTNPAVAPAATEARTIRKLQSRIIPLVFVLFVIAFVDRINIGFAALTMNKELAVTIQQYGFLARNFLLWLLHF